MDVTPLYSGTFSHGAKFHLFHGQIDYHQNKNHENFDVAPCTLASACYSANGRWGLPEALVQNLEP